MGHIGVTGSRNVLTINNLRTALQKATFYAAKDGKRGGKRRHIGRRKVTFQKTQDYILSSKKAPRIWHCKYFYVPLSQFRIRGVPLGGRTYEDGRQA